MQFIGVILILGVFFTIIKALVQNLETVLFGLSIASLLSAGVVYIVTSKREYLRIGRFYLTRRSVNVLIIGSLALGVASRNTHIFDAPDVKVSEISEAEYSNRCRVSDTALYNKNCQGKGVIWDATVKHYGSANRLEVESNGHTYLLELKRNVSNTTVDEGVRIQFSGQMDSHSFIADRVKNAVVTKTYNTVEQAKAELQEKKRQEDIAFYRRKCEEARANDCSSSYGGGKFQDRMGNYMACGANKTDDIKKYCIY